jgi:hypothetical protein
MEWRIQRVRLAKHFPGWTLEYIDSLAYADVLDVMSALDGFAIEAEEARKRRLR